MFAVDCNLCCAILVSLVAACVTWTMLQRNQNDPPQRATSPASNASPVSTEVEKMPSQTLRKKPVLSRRWWICLGIATVVVVALVLGLGLGLTVGVKHRHDIRPIVDLGYAKYQGKTLPNGIDQWLGMRYAAPPTGDLRFAAPQDPPKSGGIKPALEVSCNLYGCSPGD